MLIVKQDSNGVKPLLQVGELGYDNYPTGGDEGRVYVGTGTSNIAQAKKSEVTAVDSKVDTHVARVDNPHGVTKAQVGLGNADDTSDADKPISIATQDALNLKANADSATLTGIPTAPTAAAGTNTTQLATTAFVKTELDAKYADNVNLTGDQNISGIKTFSSPIVGNINGNSATATKLATARTINGVSFDGTANITVKDDTKAPLSNPTFTGKIVTNDSITAGQGSGSVALTVNDGGGNANITFNHAKMIPDSNGSSARITSNVDNSSADMIFTLYDNVVAGTNTGTVITPLRLTTTSATFNVNPMSTVTQSTAVNALTRKDYVDGLDSANVKLTGNQTIAGVKTFSSSPIVPTPTAGTHAANKDYVDTNIGPLSTDYYQGPYGISWDYATDTYIRTGVKGYTAIQSRMRRCVLNVDGSVNYYLHPDNSNFKADGTPSVLTGADGNVMVEIPKHYIKVETVGNVYSFSISLTQEPGYVLDPSFMKWNGTEMVEVTYRYFRAYEGFVSGGKLLSVSVVTPTRSQTIATFRTQAMANGAGWHLTDWNLLSTIRRLCYIEFCDFIVTKYLGNGNDTGSDFGITTGQSNALGNRSSNSTHNDKYMSYRGIENMYADIWEFVDGININNYQAYINQKWSTFASDVFTGDYVSKGTLIAAGASISLIKRCNVSVDGGFIPTVIGGSTTTFYGDALWSATGARVAIYGGDAGDGSSDGLGTMNVSSASSYSHVDVGAAVCR